MNFLMFSSRQSVVNISSLLKWIFIWRSTGNAYTNVGYFSALLASVIGILGFIYSFYEFLFIVIHYIIQLFIIPHIAIFVVIGACNCTFFVQIRDQQWDAEYAQYNQSEEFPNHNML